MRWRGVCLSLILTTFVVTSIASAEEHRTLNWPSRIIQLKAESAEAKPPVVTALSLHPTGLLATAGDDHVVRVWEFTKGEMVQRLAGHEDWVRTVAYSPKGDVLATAGNDKRIIFWDALTGKQLKIFATNPEAVAMIAFDPTGTYLASVGFEDKARIFDAADGRIIAEYKAPCPDMRAVAFSPDGGFLAAGGRDGKVRVWNVETGKVALEDEAHKQRIRSVEFSPDGKLLASCGEDRQIVIRPLDGDEPFMLPRRPGKIMAMAFYGKNELATAGSDNLIHLWDLESQTETGRLAGHTGTIAALLVGDKSLISASFDTTVRIWKMETVVAGRPGKRTE